MKSRIRSVFQFTTVAALGLCLLAPVASAQPPGGGGGGGCTAKPGCGACFPSAESSQGGEVTCWTCDGDSTTSECTLYCGGIQESCCDPNYHLAHCIEGAICGVDGLCHPY